MDSYAKVDVTVYDLTSQGAENVEKIVKSVLKLGIDVILKDAELCKKYGLELRPEFVVCRKFNKTD